MRPTAFTREAAEFFRQGHVVLAIAAVAAITALAYEAPITYDEAFNRLYYGQFGVGHILTSYDFPNNHLPFTVLQSFLPLSLLRWDPWFIRLFAVAIGAATVIGLLVVSRKRRTSPFVVFFAIAGSPLLAQYLFMARGYTFSGAFLVLGAAVPVVLRVRRPILGVGLGATSLAVGTWPLPIYLFAAPGWVAAMLYLYGRRVALFGAAVYAVELSLMYGPIVGQIRAQSRIAWAGNQGWWSWLGDVFVASNRAPAAFGALVAIFVVLATRSLRRGGILAKLRQGGAGRQIAVVSLATAASWFGLVGVAYALGVDALPFVRTTVPALWLFAVALSAALPRGRLEFVAAALFLPGAIAASVTWARAVNDGNWQAVATAARNNTLYQATPVTIRDAASVADRIVCSGLDNPVCQLEVHDLNRQRVRVDLPAGLRYQPRVPCAIGTHRPPSPWQVSMFLRGRFVGVLCN